MSLIVHTGQGSADPRIVVGRNIMLNIILPSAGADILKREFGARALTHLGRGAGLPIEYVAETAFWTLPIIGIFTGCAVVAMLLVACCLYCTYRSVCGVSDPEKEPLTRSK